MKRSTRYVVLKHAVDLDAWEVVDNCEASSARAAIKLYVEASGDTSGTFIAVQARIWSPLSLNVETQTRIVLE